MPGLNRKHAEQIRKKLRGIVKRARRSKHHEVEVYVGDVYVMSFGIRKGRGDDVGHGHIAAQLRLTTGEAIRLAECPLSREGWIRLMEERGHITRSPN